MPFHELFRIILADSTILCSITTYGSCCYVVVTVGRRVLFGLDEPETGITRIISDGDDLQIQQPTLGLNEAMTSENQLKLQA